MSSPSDSDAPWKWVQRKHFQHPDHPEWDLIQWDCEMELVWNPREVSRPASGDPEDVFRYMFTKEAPGLSHLPHIVILFMIASEPSGDQKGEIEGIAAWYDNEDIAMTLRRLARDRGES